MCRKHSGSLYAHGAAFPLANISPALASNPFYKTYASGPKTERGFCSTCGSSLAFNDKRDADTIEIGFGVLDEDVLCGKRDEAGAWEDEHGRHVPRIGGWGKEIAYASRQIFSENEIPGVTDGFEGLKYLTDDTSGKAFQGKVRNLKPQ
jgi:hypothetical protein